MKVYLIAGEASGDANAGALIAALLRMRGNLSMRFWGGDNMVKAAGERGNLVVHYREMAFMGVWAVLTNLPKIFQKISFCKSDITKFQPDVIVLVDYGGFNLRIAKWAKSQGYKVVYYVSPQVWASREGRVEKIRRYVDKMLCILPFEVDYYKRRGVDAIYVGHPLMEIGQRLEVSAACEPLLHPYSFVALLPGSRRQELAKMLPVMMAVAKRYPDEIFAVFMAPSIEKTIYERLIKDAKNIKLIPHRCFPLSSLAKAALVTSGTATLEMALRDVPLAVCYRTEPLFYHIAKRIIKVPYISLVNILLGKDLVKELIQGNCNEESLSKELDRLLTDRGALADMKAGYAELRSILTEKKASENAANEIIGILKTYKAP